MYAIFCVFVISGVWLAFITKLLINARRDQEIKHNNQHYYDYKVKHLYGKVQKTEEGKEDEETFEEKTSKIAGHGQP